MAIIMQGKSESNVGAESKPNVTEAARLYDPRKAADAAAKQAAYAAERQVYREAWEKAKVYFAQAAEVRPERPEGKEPSEGLTPK